MHLRSGHESTFSTVCMADHIILMQHRSTRFTRLFLLIVLVKPGMPLVSTWAGNRRVKPNLMAGSSSLAWRKNIEIDLPRYHPPPSLVVSKHSKKCTEYFWSNPIFCAALCSALSLQGSFKPEQGWCFLENLIYTATCTIPYWSYWRYVHKFSSTIIAFSFTAGKVLFLGTKNKLKRVCVFHFEK